MKKLQAKYISPQVISTLLPFWILLQVRVDIQILLRNRQHLILSFYKIGKCRIPVCQLRAKITQQARSFQRWPSSYNSKRLSALICDKKSCLLNLDLTCGNEARGTRSLWIWKRIKEKLPHKMASSKPLLNKMPIRISTTRTAAILIHQK